MSSKTCIALGLGLGLWTAAPLAGQRAPARHAFWWTFGYGYGDWRFTCSRCTPSSGNEPAISGQVALGGVLDEHLVLALELSGAALSGRRGHASAVNILASVYPWRSRGLFVRAGAGTSGYRQASYAEFPDFRGSGFGCLAALGWDLAIDRKVAFTPMLAYRAGAPGTVAALMDTLGTRFRQRSITLSFGLTFP
jgi:hypothetical protein